MPHVGNVTLAKLNPTHVQGVIDAMQDAGAAPLHIAYVHQALRAALAAAERQGLVQRNVARMVELPRRDRAEVKPLTVEEAARLLDAARHLRVGPIYTIALTLGLCVEEATGLRWQDVDLEQRVVHVRVQAQQEYGKWVEWDLVFPTPQGRPYNHRSVDKKLQAICERAGIEPTRVHELRHTCAALLRAQRVPPADVSAVLGHSGIGITNDIYGHLYEDQRQQVADAMDHALQQAR